MKSTTPSTTRFNAFKHHMATLVSTAVLSCVLVAPSASMAASGMSSLPDSAYAKMCFELTTAVYGWTQVKTEKEAIARYEAVMDGADADAAFKDSVEELFYYGMSKRHVYKGDNLKSLLMLNCPRIFKSNSQ